MLMSPGGSVSAITGLFQTDTPNAFSNGATTPSLDADSLRSAMVGELERVAAGLPSRVLVSLDLPVALLPARLRDDLPYLRRTARVLWEKPDEGILLAAFGEAISLRGSVSSSLAEATAPIRNALAGAISNVSSAARPRAFVGARFAPSGVTKDHAWDAFGAWQAFIPQVLVAGTNGQLAASLTLKLDPANLSAIEPAVQEALASLTALDVGRSSSSFVAAPGAASEQWNGSVCAALGEIGAARYQKAVLARRVAVNVSEDIDTGAVLSKLAERYPHCYIFAFRSGDAIWLGATPELLASLEGGVVRAASLAGSKPRGRDAASDACLAGELMGSAKERAEHALVALGIQEALAPLCWSLSAPEAPELLQLPNIQHLHTPVSGKLRPGHDILDVVARLHPTPAVGGWPREQAVEAIDRLEGMDRGWYAGPIGWVDFAGDGEFAVGLRAALVSGASAQLYAGAGIVVGSEPAVEYAETETKLRPLREALGVVHGVD